MMTEQVYARAVELAGEPAEGQAAMLKALCAVAMTALTARLRSGVTAEDCGADFVTAAALFALSNLPGADPAGRMTEFRAGDLTVKQGGGAAASQCLRQQAELLLSPWCRGGFSFQGV